MVGLQGTGKTTTCGKLATYLKKNGKKPMLCACDIYRPAAIDQLEVVAAGADVPVYVDRNNRKAEEIAIAARKEAERKGRDVLIVDTAGRLRIDEELMEELASSQKGRKASRNTAGSRRPHRTGRGERRRGLQREAGHRTEL